MTKSEIAKQRREFIADKQEALMRITGGAERQLLDAIYSALLTELGHAEGEIVSETGRSIKLSSAIERVFKHFNSSRNVDIIRSIINDLDTIGSLNKKYFSLFRVRAQRLSSIVQEVETTMRERIGLDENGKIVKNGYLDNLLHDASLKNEVQRATRKAMANDWTVKDLLGTVSTIVVGDNTKLGGVSSHYRTFAYDTFSQYDDGFGNEMAKKLKLNAAVYEGGLIDTSRDFCRNRHGQVFTRAEISDWKNAPDLLKTVAERKGGRLDYNPFTDKGRWNCRHQLNWISDDEARAKRPDIVIQ